jgi:ATP-dependent helicase/nuclease subunit A
MMLDDALAREQAVDPTLCCCVSAPAGSGKTSLLVKRLLRLLIRVQEPENVVAITFTRKAAAEMRARVLSALQTQDPPADADEHSRSLAALAAEVRARDAQLSWDLLANPTRLRIQTIDSFCGDLARQMPVLSGSGGQVSTTDRAEPLYREAIERFLHRELEASSTDAIDDIHRLLLHLDNRWETAVELLSGLLRRREQWQPAIGAGLKAQERDSLRGITEALVAYRLRSLRAQLGGRLATLQELMRYREDNLAPDNCFDPRSDVIRSWVSLGAFLLTGTGEWRKSLTKRDGFPAGSGEAARRKAEALALLAELREENDPNLLGSLRQLVHLPDASGEPEHWEVLAALTRLLPRLGAELLLVFQNRGEVDHPQIAMAALAALGEDGAPTDIALRLDHRIEHLLVDEFQDTSSLQFELIRRVTRGWAEQNAANPEAPRTLFLVGDAMQSIYGFREANVGLFIKAREEGIGDLELEPLALSMNFRSRATLVEWVNAQFETAFPAADDSQLGAVRYSQATRSRDPGPAPEIALFTGEGGPAAEISALCDRLEEGLARDTVETIAVLGRTRSQLRPIIQALRQRDVPFAARDLDALDERPLIRDLVTLCGVLSDRHNRFAWLSLLRSPAVALDNADLLQLALTAPTPGLLVAGTVALTALDLSAAGREAVGHLVEVLRWAEHYRDRLALRTWVEECWLRLGGAAGLSELAQQRDAEQFFALLEQFEQQRRDFNGVELELAVRELYASPGDENARVQIMTLHKAKGLEFDWVFIPSLAKTTQNSNSELLLWDEFALPGKGPSFLLDIRSGVDGDTAPRLYHYLKHQAKQKRALEATRLFYVGCTRAADYLWLGANLSWDEKRAAVRAPPSGSLLASIWPAIAESTAVTNAPEPASATAVAVENLRRLRSRPSRSVLPVESAANMQPPVDNRLARAFGTALHRCLESLAWRETLPAASDAALRSLLRVALLEAGADLDALTSLESRGSTALDRVLQEKWFRWMLAPERPFRAAELPLTRVGDDGVALPLVLDYVFVDEQRGERWVVDFKSSEPADGESVETFVARQLAQYATQLDSYRAALALRFAEPVRCALYFTALAHYAEYQG